MFKKTRDDINYLHVVLDAIISLLHKKDVIHRDEIQMEILARASEQEDESA